MCKSCLFFQDADSGLYSFIERKYRTVLNKQGRAIAGDAMMYHSLPVYEEHFGKIEMMNTQGDDALRNVSIKADDAQAWDIKRKRLREFLAALCR